MPLFRSEGTPTWGIPPKNTIQPLIHVPKGPAIISVWSRCVLYELKIHVIKNHMHLHTQCIMTKWARGKCNQICPERAEWKIHSSRRILQNLRLHWAFNMEASEPDWGRAIDFSCSYLCSLESFCGCLLSCVAKARVGDSESGLFGGGSCGTCCFSEAHQILLGHFSRRWKTQQTDTDYV